MKTWRTYYSVEINFEYLIFADITVLTTTSTNWYGNVGSSEAFTCSYDFVDGPTISANLFFGVSTNVLSVYPNASIGMPSFTFTLELL